MYLRKGRHLRNAQSLFAAQRFLTFPPFFTAQITHMCLTIQYIKVCTANEGLVRILYKCLVPIYVLPEMKLCILLISETEF